MRSYAWPSWGCEKGSGAVNGRWVSDLSLLRRRTVARRGADSSNGWSTLVCLFDFAGRAERRKG